MSGPNPTHQLPLRPKLLPYLHLMHASDGSLGLLAPEQSILLKLPHSLTRVIDTVVTNLDGVKTVPEIISAVQANLPGTETEMVMVVLNYLAQQHLLIDNAVPVPDELDEYAQARWNRNFSFFMPFENSQISRFDYQTALGKASIALIGLGGIGSWIAYNLAMVGLGRMVSVDSDQVSLDNLNRQVLYSPADVGKNKIDVAARILATVSPTMKFEGALRRIRSEDDFVEIIRGTDLAILAADQPQGLIERWANAACFAQRIPWLSAGLQGHRVIVGPLYIPGLSGCWSCLDTERRRSKYYAESFEALATHSFVGQPSLAPMCSLAGGLAAYEAIKYVSGFARPTILGREMRIDTTTMQVEWRETKQRTDCAVCHIPMNEQPALAVRLPKKSSRSFLSRLLQRS